MLHFANGDDHDDEYDDGDHDDNEDDDDDELGLFYMIAISHHQ